MIRSDLSDDESVGDYTAEETVDFVLDVMNERFTGV